MIWKNKVSKSNVLLYLLQASVRGIKEKEYGLLATPTKMDFLPPRSKEGTLKHLQARKGRMRPGNLREQLDPTTMSMYPTPTTNEAEHPQMILNEKGRRLPTKGKTDHSLNLADTVRLYPTPRSCELEGGVVKNVELVKGSFSRKNKKGVRFGVKLKDAIHKMYGTPKAQDERAALTDRGKGNFGEQVHQEYNAKEVGGRLNPSFVEFLMGYPQDWTKIEAKESKVSETQSYHKLQEK
tara:strand:+ start:107 stop:820 length:714 start_codon:yes stop_codon:yes gene_type:complete